ncbi:hypothetical protein RB195_013667 [Necator americanus]|uniref:Uncharacterized protein n=1 Tax=Necator americanus TaxID=51031 RepID=A0ABR1DWM7_NECAM
MAPPFKKNGVGEFYPPSKFAIDASSPYFIGKHKSARRRIEKGENLPAKKATLAGHGFGGDGFSSGIHTECSREEKVRRESSITRASSLSSGSSVNACNGLAFDFSSDPKLRRVREVIVSIVDSISH